MILYYTIPYNDNLSFTYKITKLRPFLAPKQAIFGVDFAGPQILYIKGVSTENCSFQIQSRLFMSSNLVLVCYYSALNQSLSSYKHRRPNCHRIPLLDKIGL